MSKHSHANGPAAHTHGAGADLCEAARRILENGLRRLLEMTEGLEFRATSSERSPLPLRAAVYRHHADAAEVRADVEARMQEDPVSVLEGAWALLELYECNQQDIEQYILEDGAFTDVCFESKRLNGWIAVMGDADASQVEAAVNAKWQFRFLSGPPRPTGIYVLMSMLARYALVYGKAAPGDPHALGHFVEDFTPGVLVCQGAMSDLELTLSLAAMKMGIPAVTPPDYPFELGRQIRAATLDDATQAVVAFPNIRRLLDVPETPPYPDYCDTDNMSEKFEPATVIGETAESFFVFRKGRVENPGAVTVSGDVADAMGVVVTAEAEPLDAFDRAYIERTIAVKPGMISGVSPAFDGRRLALRLRDDADFDPQRIGEVLVSALRHEFPKIRKVSAEIIFDADRLAEIAPGVREEKARRDHEVAQATEESVAEFVTCVGCSPFAPSHVCILTPERRPQCGRQYEQIKTGALYGYDDMSNIHHSSLHRGINSFGIVAKGEAINADAGEWAGVNARSAELSGGRTTRIQLHSINDFPHTGCGCFRMVMFKTAKPRPGIGVMDAGFQGRSPDGRGWRDLHYSLAGKQTPGIAGASPTYLRSEKFLKAHGGWDAVVWVSPTIAEIMGDALPAGVEVGRTDE